MASSPLSLSFVANPYTTKNTSEASGAMTLRRSLMGSLRANSAIKRAAIATSQDEENADKHSIPIMTQDLALDDVAEFQMPEFERSINLAYTTHHNVDRVKLFEQCLDVKADNHYKHRFFGLPAVIRLQIYGLCFPVEWRKITLSNAFATKAVFTNSIFASPFDVQQSVFGGLRSFGTLRHELMVYFWTQYQFHVTLSHFTARPFFSPLSRIWLLSYLPIIQFLTIEIDLTKFGLGVFEGASTFGNNVEPIEDMVEELMTGLSQRRNHTIMMELNVLCRRYAGSRPQSQPFGEEVHGGPYCPELATLVCDSISQMQGLLQHCRIAGFTRDYTERLLSLAFNVSPQDYKWAIETAPAWPPLSEVEPDLPLPHSRIYKDTILAPLVSKPSYINRTSGKLFAANLRRAFSTTSPSTPASIRLRGVIQSQPSTPRRKGSPRSSPFTGILIPKLSAFATSLQQASPRSINYSSCSNSPLTPNTPTPYLPLFGPTTSTAAICPEYKLKLSRSRSFQESFQERLVSLALEEPSSAEIHSAILQPTTIDVAPPPAEKKVVEISGKEDRSSATLLLLKDKDVLGTMDVKADMVSTSVSSPTPEDNIGEQAEDLQIHDIEQHRVYNLDLSAVSQNQDCESNVRDELPAVPVLKIDHKASLDTRDTPRLPETPARRSRIPVLLTKTPIARIRPALYIAQNSPNTMNNMNEQDPAFMRTMNAMRSFSDPPRSRKCLEQPSPLPAKPAMSNHLHKPAEQPSKKPSLGGRRKYFTLVSRLRGRFEKGSE